MMTTSSFHFYFLKSKFSFRFFSYLSNADAAWPVIWPLGHKVPESDDPTPTGPLTWLESLCLPTLSGQNPESADFIPIRSWDLLLNSSGLQFLPEKGENGASFDLLPHNASQLGGRGRRRIHIRVPALSLNGCDRPGCCIPKTFLFFGGVLMLKEILKPSQMCKQASDKYQLSERGNLFGWTRTAVPLSGP